jgi:hypothetical protein
MDIDAMTMAERFWLRTTTQVSQAGIDRGWGGIVQSDVILNITLEQEAIKPQESVVGLSDGTDARRSVLITARTAYSWIQDECIQLHGHQGDFKVLNSSILSHDDQLAYVFCSRYGNNCI